MAKPWKEVEGSKGYNSLSPRDKFVAKKDYWNEVVLPKREYQLMDNASQKQAKKEFFGGVLREDIPEFSSKDAALEVIGKTISETGSVIGKSAGKLATGIVQPIIHPIQTVKGISNLLSGTFQKIIPGKQANEVHFDNLAKMYKDRYGSVDAIADTVATDPFGFISDVYMVAGATSGLSKLSKNQALIKSTSFPMTGKAISSTASNIKKLNPVKSVEDKIFNAYNKSIGSKGKLPKNLKKIKSETINRVKAIQENLPEEGMTNGLTGEKFNIPTNRYENLIASETAAQKVWEKANKLSEGATEAGAKIDIGKVAETAKKSTIKGFGEIAEKTTKSAIVSKIDEAVEALKTQYPNGVTPTQAQGFLKTLRKDAQALRESGQSAYFEMRDFHTNLYEALRDNTDSVIEATLQKSGYGHYRNQYKQIVSARKDMTNAANAFIRQETGRGFGVSHPIVNLFSIESIVSGAVTGRPTQGIIKAAYLQASKKILDWTVSRDAPIQGMYKNAAKLKSIEPVHVFNPEILDDVVINEKLLLPAPEKIISKTKRIANETGAGVLITENPIKRLTYSNTSEGVRFSPEYIKPEYGPGLGKFIMKESKEVIKKSKKIKAK